MKLLCAALLLMPALCFGIQAPDQVQPLPRKPFLGAQLQVPTPEMRKERAWPDEGGLLIGNVIPGTTAETGLKAGDLLLSIAAKPIAAPPNVTAAIQSVQTGQPVQVEVLRDGKRQTLTLTTKPRPADNGDNYETLYETVVSNGKRVRVFITRPKGVAGKRPVMFLIQGVGYVSMEQPMSGPGSYSRIRKAFNDKGYVTMLVEKPGLGDSEGTVDELTYDTEMDAFRAAMKALPKYDFVDSDNVLIFGHSMGGCQGPMLASEFKNIKGLAVYGTVARTWMEYIIENTRRQALLGGANPAAVDGQIRRLIAADHLLFNENLTPEEAKKQFPKWADAISTISGDGKTMSGISWPYWQACFSHNLADYWMKVDANVLSIWGASEFIASEIDHPYIAQIVNARHPGRARYVKIENSDHGFRNVATPEESFKTWSTGGPQLNLEIVKVLTEWADQVIPPK